MAPVGQCTQPRSFQTYVGCSKLARQLMRVPARCRQVACFCWFASGYRKGVALQRHLSLWAPLITCLYQLECLLPCCCAVLWIRDGVTPAISKLSGSSSSACQERQGTPRGSHVSEGVEAAYSASAGGEVRSRYPRESIKSCIVPGPLLGAPEVCQVRIQASAGE